MDNQSRDSIDLEVANAVIEFSDAPVQVTQAHNLAVDNTTNDHAGEVG